VSGNPKNDLLKKIIMGDKGDHIPSIDDKHKFKSEFLQFCVNEGLAQNEHNAKIKLECDEDTLLTMELEFMRKYGFKPSRITRISEKMVNSLIEDGKLNEFIKEDKKLTKKFLRNNKLVNLTAQPKYIQEQIVKQYSDCELKVGIENLFMYFVKYKFNEFLDDTTRISNLLKSLTK
jgi:hypothetical protein